MLESLFDPPIPSYIILETGVRNADIQHVMVNVADLTIDAVTNCGHRQPRSELKFDATSS